MSWDIAFGLPVAGFSVAFFTAIGIAGHRQNLSIRRSPRSVEGFRRRAVQQRPVDTHTRSTEP